MYTDFTYAQLLLNVQENGDLMLGRNGLCSSRIDIPGIKFTDTPLVTVRKTAWKKAIQEMEWFMSGSEICSSELLSWWRAQLNQEGAYRNGYSKQFRLFGGFFDQVHSILEGLKGHPNSRRLVFTAWNPSEMSSITEVNGNPNTPTTCHTTILQFFVRSGKLCATSYQRSADLLLGVPHNWIQSWALLQWFAYHSNLAVGHLLWLFGDAHIYQQPSHLETVQAIKRALPSFKLYDQNPFKLVYTFGGGHDVNNVPLFRADDFTMEGTIPSPLVTTKPVLLA